MKRNKIAQSMVEYTILIALVAAGIIMMNKYVFRGVWAGLKMWERQVEDAGKVTIAKWCGDGICQSEIGETKATCIDCSCPDNVCNYTETCYNCPQDCLRCPCESNPGGTWVSDGWGTSMCRMNLSSCPSLWKQHGKWSTTQGRSDTLSSGVCNNWDPGRCDSGWHDWGNPDSSPNCKYEGGSAGGCVGGNCQLLSDGREACCRYGKEACWGIPPCCDEEAKATAIMTQIGCVPE